MARIVNFPFKQIPNKNPEPQRSIVEGAGQTLTPSHPVIWGFVHKSMFDLHVHLDF